MALIDDTIDIACVADFSPDMPSVRGRAALAQRLGRRLQTPRGKFPWWKNFGTDLRAYLLSKQSGAAIASAAESECLKDEQVDDASVKAEFRQFGRELHLTIEITDAAGPFAFTLAITEAAATLILLQNAA